MVKAKTASYQEMVNELNQIVERMSSDNLSLEEQLEAFSKGVSLIKDCENTLSKAEQQVAKILAQNKVSSATTAQDPE